MPTIADVVVVLLVLVVSILEYVYFWPRFRAAIDAGRPGARLQTYRCIVVGEWAFALAPLVIWKLHGRPWNAMGLSLLRGWRLGLSIGFVVAALALVGLQLWSVLRLPIARRIAARPKLG